MAATLVERVPLNEITAQARQVRFGVTALAVTAFILIMIGRIAGYAWLIPVWCAVAVREGWRDVHPPRPEVSRGLAGAR